MTTTVAKVTMTMVFIPVVFIINTVNNFIIDFFTNSINLTHYRSHVDVDDDDNTATILLLLLMTFTLITIIIMIMLIILITIIVIIMVILL